MKLCTCFSALVSSSLRAITATTKAVHPAPCDLTTEEEEEKKIKAKLQFIREQCI